MRARCVKPRLPALSHHLAPQLAGVTRTASLAASPASRMGLGGRLHVGPDPPVPEEFHRGRRTWRISVSPSNGPSSSMPSASGPAG
jgi:hypothetical protein